MPTVRENTESARLDGFRIDVTSLTQSAIAIDTWLVANLMNFWTTSKPFADSAGARCRSRRAEGEMSPKL